MIQTTVYNDVCLYHLPPPSYPTILSALLLPLTPFISRRLFIKIPRKVGNLPSEQVLFLTKLRYHTLRSHFFMTSDMFSETQQRDIPTEPVASVKCFISSLNHSIRVPLRLAPKGPQYGRWKKTRVVELYSPSFSSLLSLDSSSHFFFF
jgi:hypothetical protein